MFNKHDHEDLFSGLFNFLTVWYTSVCVKNVHRTEQHKNASTHMSKLLKY